MLHLIIYDVVNDARRSKVHSALKDFGVKVQFSAFEARLHPRERTLLLRRVAPLIDPLVDRFAIYPITQEQESRIACVGMPRPEHRRAAFMVV